LVAILEQVFRERRVSAMPIKTARPHVLGCSLRSMPKPSPSTILTVCARSR
jgi:hypothetical protein